MGASKSKPWYKHSRITKQDKILLTVKSLRDKVKIYQTNIEKMIQGETLMAKKLLVNGHRTKAACLVRRKIALEKQLEKTDSHLENLETIIMRLEQSRMERTVIEGLKAGKKALERIHKVMTIKNVEAILKESEEGIRKQIEIDGLISGMLTNIDEISLEIELEELIINESGPSSSKRRSTTPTRIVLPDVPSMSITTPSHKKTSSIKHKVHAL